LGEEEHRVNRVSDQVRPTDEGLGAAEALETQIEVALECVALVVARGLGKVLLTDRTLVLSFRIKTPSLEPKGMSILTSHLAFTRRFLHDFHADCAEAELASWVFAGEVIA
jgi:hypothetical protein